MALHHNEPPPERVYAPPPGGALRDKIVQRIVYGYFPHWMSDINALQWDLLTHVAYFGVTIDGTGAVVAQHGWPVQALVQAAADTETSLHITIALFDVAAIAQLCASSTYRSTAIDNIIAMMEAGPADGVSIDFESPNAATRDDFTLFIAELRAEMDARGYQDAEISIAGTAWSNIGGIDLDALLDHIDIYFIMAYPYFGSWSNRTGPVGKLRTTTEWASTSTLSTARTVARYTQMVSAADRHKIVLGVPYYGWRWTCADDNPHAAVNTSVGSVFYSESRADLDAGRTRLWDPGVRGPWYTWQDGSFNQVWYEDEESLAHKYQLALDQDLGGVGMWALNYDLGYTELWDLLETTFGQDPPVVHGDRFDPIRITTFPYHDQRDTSNAPSNYFNYYSCLPDLPEYGREWVYRIDVCQPGTLTAHVPEYPDVDPDLHLLDGASEDACLGRAHLDLEVDIQPGMYLLTVDTWVNNDDVQLEGPYDLDVNFTPEPGSEGCAGHLVCQAGSCVCPDTQTDCGDYCADLQTDPENCGDCGHTCDPNHSCVAGECVAPTADASLDAAATSDSQISNDASLLPCCPCPDDGCGCRSRGKPLAAGHVSYMLLALLGLALIRLRDRRH
jgi:MYXO-CTERM domain-containing protein